jgi:hypothetical protein
VGRHGRGGAVAFGTIGAVRTVRRRSVALLVAGVLAATGVAGVPAPAQADDGARTVTVPALWAGTDAKGRTVSGIERATVTTRETARPEFEVDLGSVKAAGAGPQWVAASAVAAAVGMLYAGNDPRVYGARYTVTGPIDGPSAGAILTVGTLAALRGDRLQRKVTMTGTIAPDGTIGRVGLILDKIKAAAKASFSTVLIPYGTERQTGPDGPVDARNFGADLGVEVVVVDDLVTAYRAFTGKDLVPALVGLPEPVGPVEAVAVATARALADRIDVALAALPAGVDPAVRVTLEVAAADVRRAVVVGDTDTAYGLGVDTYQNLVRAAAEARTRQALADTGPVAVRAALSAEVDALIADATRRLTAGADVSGLGLGQQLAMPIALGWQTFALGSFEFARTVLADPAATPDDLILVADLLADQRAGVEVFGPDAEAAVRAMPAERAPAAGRLAGFLSGYSTFLRTSGDANVKYVRALAGGGDLTDINPVVAGTVLAMQQNNGSIDARTASLADEVTQLARAVSYFAQAQMLVSGTSFGLVGFGAGSDARLQRSDPTLLANSVWGGGALAMRSAAETGEFGERSDYGIWQTEWALALFDALDGTPRIGAAGAIALGEIWYALIGSRINIAAVEAFDRR